MTTHLLPAACTAHTLHNEAIKNDDHIHLQGYIVFVLFLTEVYMVHVKSEIHPVVMRKAAICFLKSFVL